MATIRFYLRSQKTDPAAIMLRLYYDSNEFAISTGQSVSPKFWNQDKQRATGKTAEDINSEISLVASKVLAAYNFIKTELQEVTNDLLKKKLAGKEIFKTTRFYAYVEEIIERKKKESKKRAGRYQVVFNRIKVFAHTYYKRELDFADINLDFYSKYLDFLKTTKKLAASTIQVEIKVLKRFMNLATVEGINTNMIFKSTDFKAPSYSKKHIYIDEDELSHLFNLKLTGYLERTRDIFVIGCRTGLRVSDYWRCVSDAVDESGLICIDDTQKTGEAVYIPLHWQVRFILDKYKGTPPQISDVNLNKYLKILGKEAKLDNLVTDSRAHATGQCPKYELITTHTARRSCATNMYLAGFDLYFIQGILGHRKIETTVKYLGVTRKAAAMKYLNTPYFLSPVTAKSVTENVTERP